MEREPSTLDFWTPDDALSFRCSVAEVGTLKPDVSRETQPGNTRADAELCRAHAPRAVRALVRIMESGETRAALEAAREILARAYGPPLAPAPLPAPQPQLPEASAPTFPDWLDAQRHAYRAPDYAPGDSLPSQHQPRQCLPRQ